MSARSVGRLFQWGARRVELFGVLALWACAAGWLVGDAGTGLAALLAVLVSGVVWRVVKIRRRRARARRLLTEGQSGEGGGRPFVRWQDVCPDRLLLRHAERLWDDCEVPGRLPVHLFSGAPADVDVPEPVEDEPVAVGAAPPKLGAIVPVPAGEPAARKGSKRSEAARKGWEKRRAAAAAAKQAEVSEVPMPDDLSEF